MKLTHRLWREVVVWVPSDNHRKIIIIIIIIIIIKRLRSCGRDQKTTNLNVLCVECEKKNALTSLPDVCTSEELAPGLLSVANQADDNIFPN